MPGNSWQDLHRRPVVLTGQSAAPRPTAPAASVSPQLKALLEQKQQLEANLRNLMSGRGSLVDKRESARFSVPSFAERRAQHQQWEQQRDQRLRHLQQHNPSLLSSSASSRGRNGQRRFQQPVEAWLDQRDKDRQALRGQARDRLQRFDRTVQPLRNALEQIRSTTGQFRDLDQKLAAEGLEDERKELNRLGMDKINKVDKSLQKATQILDAPSRAVNKIDDFWLKKDNAVRGQMDKSGAYVDNSRRRLGLDSGGSGDLFERMQQNRERALQQRREQYRQEQQDQARRDRALARKKDKQDE
jgi:hypothetical protein